MMSKIVRVRVEFVTKVDVRKANLTTIVKDNRIMTITLIGKILKCVESLIYLETWTDCEKKRNYYWARSIDDGE